MPIGLSESGRNEKKKDQGMEKDAKRKVILFRIVSARRPCKAILIASLHVTLDKPREPLLHRNIVRFMIFNGPFVKWFRNSIFDKVSKIDKIFSQLTFQSL